MRQIIMLACIFAGSLAAENIGNVEYHLPTDREWKIINEQEGKADNIKSMTRIYIPKDSTVDNSTESFGVEEFDLPSGEVDQAALEKLYEIQFPSQKAEIKIIDKSPESVLYSWSLNDGRYGWTRIFTAPDETVLLSYQTAQKEKIKDLGPIWIKVLQEAKMVNGHQDTNGIKATDKDLKEVTK